jgi:hypothetical protein
MENAIGSAACNARDVATLGSATPSRQEIV